MDLGKPVREEPLQVPEREVMPEPTEAPTQAPAAPTPKEPVPA